MGPSGAVPTLKEFMLQRRVLKLYRDFFRATRDIQNEASRKEVQEWIRQDFKKNKNEKSDDAIRLFLYQGERSLRELKNSTKNPQELGALHQKDQKMFSTNE